MRYADETPLQSFNTGEVAARLEALVSEYAVSLPTLTNTEVKTDGRWSQKEILGHLIDSALNNLQRAVRLQLQPTLELPGYEQNGWVSVQHYQDRSWSDLVALWSALNLQLAHVIRHANLNSLVNTWRFEGEDLTLAFILEDYVAHIEHHMRQIFA
jgi:DinB superfamily